MLSLRKFSIVLVAAIMAALPAQRAIAWGAQGHRVTAWIAQDLLSPTAAVQLKAILGQENLATAANYLDVHKSALAKSIEGSRDWHYDDRPACDAQAARADYCPGGNCASVQLRRHYAILIDPDRSPEEKRFAVRVIAHLTGDIHQPLHASDHDDAGGNGVKLLEPGPNGPWEAGRKANLHSAWDNDFVTAAFKDDAYKSKSDREIGALLAGEINDNDRNTWRVGRISAWLEESYSIATNLAYGKLGSFACTLEEADAKPVALSAEYMQEAIAIIPEQLKKGGVRLAAILNRALDPSPQDGKKYVRAGYL